MTSCEINGILRKSNTKFDNGVLYWLEVPRRSETGDTEKPAVDTLMVIVPEETLPEGCVHIVGHVEAAWLPGFGVPTFVVPHTVVPFEGPLDGLSRTTITGSIKEDPVMRTTHQKKTLSTVLVITDEGTIPVLLWGKNAEKAQNEFQAGDIVDVVGRLKSRIYRPKNGIGPRTAYELSAKTFEPAGRGAVHTV